MNAATMCVCSVCVWRVAVQPTRPRSRLIIPYRQSRMHRVHCETFRINAATIGVTASSGSSSVEPLNVADEPDFRLQAQVSL